MLVTESEDEPSESFFPCFSKGIRIRRSWPTKGDFNNLFDTLARSFGPPDDILVQFIQKVIIEAAGKITEEDGANSDGRCDEKC